jgi:hypothetical protein
MDKEIEMQEEQRKQRIQEMKEKLQRLSGHAEPIFFSQFKDSVLEEKFLEQMCFMEGVGEQPLFDMLENKGIQLPESAGLNDAQLQAKLWEVINGMASLGCYLSSTDHLSDRQLYDLLWTDLLREPASACPDDSCCACHIDVLGGCSEEDLQLRLKYYADEYERLSWADEYPEDAIPPHEPLPYDRDRHLPLPPYENARPVDCQ